MENDSRLKGLIRLIFSYLMETGGEIEEDDAMVESLVKEGYSYEEIEKAMDWVAIIMERSIYLERDEILSDLESINNSFVRPFHPEEREKLTQKAQGLIYWLTFTGQLSPSEREDILDIASYIGEDITDQMLFSILDTLFISKEHGKKDPLYRYYYN